MSAAVCRACAAAAAGALGGLWVHLHGVWPWVLSGWRCAPWVRSLVGWLACVFVSQLCGLSTRCTQRPTHRLACFFKTGWSPLVCEPAPLPVHLYMYGVCPDCTGRGYLVGSGVNACVRGALCLLVGLLAHQARWGTPGGSCAYSLCAGCAMPRRVCGAIMCASGSLGVHLLH